MEKMRKPFKVDKNGTQYFADYTCPRCGGAGGADQWKFTGWTCYKCGGTGKTDKPEIWKVYTPEYEAKLNARRKARQEKKNAEERAKAAELNRKYFEREGFDESTGTWAYIGDTYKVREELKAAGAKFDYAIGWHSAQQIEGYPAVYINIEISYNLNGAAYGYDIPAAQRAIEEAKHSKEVEESTSEYVGKVGDKVEFEGTYVKCAWYEVPSFSGYGMDRRFVHTMKDEKGNIYIWKTSRGFGDIGKGDKIKVKGTVKEHSEYEEIKQTILTRCKVEKI